VDREARARARGQAELAVHRLRAVVAGAHREAFLAEELRDVVRMDAFQVERGERTAFVGFAQEAEAFHGGQPPDGVRGQGALRLGDPIAAEIGAFLQTPCPADRNCDAFVNADDFDLFAEAFDGGTTDADFNADGFVNGDDYDAFAEHFEAGC